jgi:uncharacterized heparinase superfamily protein
LGIWFNRIKRGIRRSPVELYYRLVIELRAFFDRFTRPFIQKLTDIEFVKLFGFDNIDSLWSDLAERPFVTDHSLLDPNTLNEIIPGEFERIIGLADQALEWKVDILGSGPTSLSKNSRWNTDFKVGFDWPMIYFRDIDVLNLDKPSDVKIPWELSRMQWLIPVGQAYQITGDAKYSYFCCEVLKDWISANSYGQGINWAIAMEPAMRIFSWTWLFHVFKNSSGWSDPAFRILFLRSLYEHGIFVERYMENFGINGNHCTADAGGLVFIGFFFDADARSKKWAKIGWDTLQREISHQILDDGVDFEGSIAYHRFVSELFFWPARFCLVKGEKIPKYYITRLLMMADFIESYTKPSGLAPLWGDADDGRVLPFGGESLNDHSYLADLIRFQWGNIENRLSTTKSKAEILWTYGAYDNSLSERSKPISRCFINSGFYIMANDKDHIFIDCGPVGFGGRGVHGHNDCLSFEAVLEGVPLVSDCGSYVYSASYIKRNEYRSTSAHNTPIIDNQEQNRFISEAELFSLHNDAIPKVLSWQTNVDIDTFIGSHSGYLKLNEPVTPVRTIILEKKYHRLIIKDEFKGTGEHNIKVPLHLATDCEVRQVNDVACVVSSGGTSFVIQARRTVGWSINIVEGLISPRYGVTVKNIILEFRNKGPLETLLVGIYPEKSPPETPINWLDSYL